MTFKAVQEYIYLKQINSEDADDLLGDGRNQNQNQRNATKNQQNINNNFNQCQPYPQVISIICEQIIGLINEIVEGRQGIFLKVEKETDSAIAKGTNNYPDEFYYLVKKKGECEDLYNNIVATPTYSELQKLEEALKLYK